MTTTENNKLLAEFMNWEYTIVNNTTLQTTLISDLDFSKDWSWLMQVVDKIYEMDLYYDRYIDYNSSMISDGKINLGTRINRVYEQVVEFIKWYNENSAKNN